MRDHKKLKAFQLSDRLALEVYRNTRSFPRDEVFGLRAQMRRCAVSVPSNIVEGCARPSESDYLRFLDIAYASACELQYQVSLARRLRLLQEEESKPLEELCEEVTKVLNGLLRSYRRKRAGPR